MTEIIQNLRKEHGLNNLDKWQKIALDILEKKFESLMFRTRKNALPGPKIEFKDYKSLCLFLEDKHKELKNTSRWCYLQAKFNLSKKQSSLIERSLIGRDRDCGLRLLNDALINT